MQRRQAVRQRPLAGALRQQLGQGAGDDGRAARRLVGGDEAVDRGVPAARIAALHVWIVDHQDADVEAALHHGGEAALQRRHVAPDRGVVVEGIGDGGEHRHLTLEIVRLLPAERRKLQPRGFGEIGDQRGFAARAGEDAQPGAGQRAHHGQQFEGFQQAGDRVDPNDPEAREEGLVELVGAGQRAGVAERHLGADIGGADLEGDDRDVLLERPRGGAAEGGDVAQALHVEADGGDAWILDQRLESVADAEDRLIADADHVAERDRTAGHREI